MPLAREFYAKILYIKQTERLPERFSYIICDFFYCGVIDKVTHRKNYNCYIKPCTFYRSDKVFSTVHSLIQNLSIGDQQANLNYLQGNFIQDSEHVNWLIKTCHWRVVLKIGLPKQLFCAMTC